MTWRQLGSLSLFANVREGERGRRYCSRGLEEQERSFFSTPSISQRRRNPTPRVGMGVKIELVFGPQGRVSNLTNVLQSLSPLCSDTTVVCYKADDKIDWALDACKQQLITLRVSYVILYTVSLCGSASSQLSKNVKSLKNKYQSVHLLCMQQQCEGLWVTAVAFLKQSMQCRFRESVQDVFFFFFPMHKLTWKVRNMAPE